MSLEKPSTGLKTNFLERAVVVMPALNEEACVARAVLHWIENGAMRVRVVDSDSRDATCVNATTAGAEVLRENRRGYGAAAWRGARDLPATVEWIVFCSADGSDRLDQAEKASFQAAIDDGAEFVLGERVSSPESRRHLKLVQRFGNALGCRLIALGWGYRFRDMASLRVIRHDAFERLQLLDRGFGWNVEMQIRAVEKGLRVAEVPVRYHPRTGGEPKISGNPLGMLRAGRGILSTIGMLYLTRQERRLRKDITTQVWTRSGTDLPSVKPKQLH